MVISRWLPRVEARVHVVVVGGGVAGLDHGEMRRSTISALMVMLGSKLGSMVSLLDVVQNGSQYQHGQWGGVVHRTAAFTATFDSLDVATVSPNTPDPTPFPADPEAGMAPLQPGSVRGVSFVLFSNAYNTNYPLW